MSNGITCFVLITLCSSAICHLRHFCSRRTMTFRRRYHATVESNIYENLSIGYIAMYSSRLCRRNRVGFRRPVRNNFRRDAHCSALAGTVLHPSAQSLATVFEYEQPRLISWLFMSALFPPKLEGKSSERACGIFMAAILVS